MSRSADFTAEFYQAFREELRLMILKLLYKVEKENSIYEANIPLIAKSDKDTA